MGIGFDWQTSEEGERPVMVRRGAGWRGWLFLLGVGLLTGLILGGWWLGRRQEAAVQDRLRQQVQAVLDLERQAMAAGDGELFFSVQAGDPAWLAAQLQPANQAVTRAGVQVTRVEQQGDDVWANVAWMEDGNHYQRITFWQRQDGRLLHLPSSADYWGASLPFRYGWGSLAIQEADQQWAAEIAVFVEQVVAEVCAAGCLPERRPERLPFTLTVAPDYRGTALPNQLRVPSPRLVALDEAGQPAAPFWAWLRREVEGQLMQATIRFAVPAHLLSRYQLVAADFQAVQGSVTVELVGLAELPADLAAAGLDGAAWPPTEAMVAAGAVRDLTDYLESDPGFDQGDFYEQIWQGAWWQERMWLMPLAAEMPLLFYDREAYQQAGLAEPTPEWTWAQLNEEIGRLAAGETNEAIEWAFIDGGPDTLLAYAYNWENRCAVATVRCNPVLRPGDVTAAFTWYAAIAGQPGQLPDLSGLAAAERAMVVLNLVSPRHVALWVDRPASYELHLARRPLGVTAFPGQDRLGGVTPLWVRGGFVSAQSQRPVAVWQWLKFLSYQNIAREERLVPARPSVAVQSEYWALLPQPLWEVMRLAFPLGRPVRLGEAAYFSWEQVAAVLAGEITAEEVGQRRPEVRWFEE
jgi:ABC-type glycerol-3-phosphate transport system substrate-binding protein